MPTSITNASADRRLLRAATRRQHATKFMIVVVVVLAAIGGLGQIVSGVSAIGRMIAGGTSSTSSIDTTATDTAAGVTDFAQSFVMDYLAAAKCPGSNQDCSSADLSAYYTGSLDLPETKIDAIDPQVYSVLAEPGPLPNLQLWSGVVRSAARWRRKAGIVGSFLGSRVRTCRGICRRFRGSGHRREIFSAGFTRRRS